MLRRNRHSRLIVDINATGRLYQPAHVASDLPDMLEIIEACAPITPEGCADADPQAMVLVGTLDGCCHPRAGRLKARLVDCQCHDQLAQLRAEVTHLLTLSFGPAEAQRRLQALQ